MALTTAERTNIIKLVVGMFNAAPGATYLADLTVAYEANGRSLENLARDLSNTTAYKTLNPVFQTASEFAAVLLTPYGLQANTVALDFVTAKFNAGVNKGQIAYDVAAALEATTDTQFADAKAILTNKTSAAEYYTITLAAASTNISTLQQSISTVTKDAATVTAANTANAGGAAGGSGQTFTLTKDVIDNIVGTAGNDTIIGDAAGTSAADQVNGGAGTDTLKLVGTVTRPTMTSIEHIYLDQAAAQAAFNASTVTGLEKLTLANHTTDTGKTSLTIATGQTVVLENVQKTASYLEIAAAATVTAATLVLDKAGNAASGGAALDIEVEATGVKTLNIQTSQNASRVAFLDANTNSAVDTVNITGDKNLTAAINASSATKVTVAAGTFTGALNLDLSAAENFEVTGGTGADRFNFGGNLDATDKVAGGDGIDTLATSTATVNAAFAAIVDGKTNGVNNNSSLEVLEYTGTGAYVLDASLIQMATLKTYSTTGAIAPAQPTGAGSTVGTTAMAVTGQANAQTFSIEANVTGGAGQANTGGAGGAGGNGVTFAPAVNNGDNTLNLSLKGVTITGGRGGDGSATTNGGNGGNAADFSNFETINITSTGATATAVNTFTAGAISTSGGGTAGSTVVVSANAKINISGANEISIGNIASGNQPVTIDASALTGKMTVGTGTGADVIKGGAGVNLITLAGGADQVDLSKSAAKADVITVTAATSTSSTAYISVTGFTNSGTATIGDKLDVIGTAAVQADVTAGTATGVTNLTAGVASGIMTFTGSAAATATLANKVAAAASTNFAGAQNEVVAFEHNGNTYIMHQAGATANAFDAGEDTLIELVGVTGVTALSTAASGATTIWVA